METILIQAFQLISCLSLLVFIHEGGHFLFAKFSGVKVEKFYLFFNPYFHLFSTRDKWFRRLFPYFRDNETEYGIGWIPLGGYVSIAGMVDETKGAEEIAARAPEASDFNQKPVWRRFLIMVGGVLFNLIAALVIYSAILFTWGKDTIPIRNLPHGLHFNAQATEIGFRNGDIPVRIDGSEVTDFSGSLMLDISEATVVTVLREGKEVDITMPEEGVSLLEMQKEPMFFSLPIAPIVSKVAEDTPAEKYGIQSGDSLLSLDGTAVADISDITLELARRRDIISAEGCTREDSLRAMSLSVVLLRKGAVCPDTLAVRLNDDARLGVHWDVSAEMHNIPTLHHEYSLLESIPAGCALAWNTLVNYTISLKYLFDKEGVRQVGSFLTMGSLFPAAWDWHSFWGLTAFISIILAVMNILPIPGLDGGHIVLLLYEGIFRKAPSPKAMDIVEKVGLFLLLALMLLAISNDFIRFVF